MRLKRQGERRVHRIGRYPDMSIKERRAKAAQLVAVERGAAHLPVSDAIDEFMDTMIRPKYKRTANAETYSRRIKNRLGNLSLDKVEARDVSLLVRAYTRDAPVAAARCLGFSKLFFRWCVGAGYPQRSPLSDLMGAAFGFEEKPRERVLSDDDLRAFWNADDLPRRAMLRFLLLTGLRIGEAQAARLDWLGAGWHGCSWTLRPRPDYFGRCRQPRYRRACIAGRTATRSNPDGRRTTYAGRSPRAWATRSTCRYTSSPNA